MTSPIRILIVEDEAILAEDLRETLERHGYQVVDVVDNADDAQQRVENLRPDMVMMDIHIAGDQDGISAASRIRQSIDVPVVFLTAHSDAATLERAKQSSPYGYLVKPFDDQELRATIETTVYRHQSDSQLRGMERWLRTTLTSMGDGVIAVDLGRRITFMNPVAEAITGWSREEAIGLPYETVFKIFDPEGDPITSPLAPVLDEGKDIRFDERFKLQTRQGNQLRIDDSAAPIRDDNDQLEGAVIIFRDATERWELEDLRRKDARRHEEAKRLESLGVLAAGISHDFNNLLAIIMGHSEIISDSPNLSGGERKSIDNIRDAARRATHLCEQMHSYAEDDNFERVSLDLGALVRETVEVMSGRIPENITVELNAPADLAFAKGHNGRLQQMLNNLLINAVESLAERTGKISVSVETVPMLPPDLRLSPREDVDAGIGWGVLRVHDDGSGIRPEDLDRVFDPFFSTKFIGRGLGLSIVFNAVKAHRGGIALHSEPRAGSQFDIYLPLTEETPRTLRPAFTSADWKPLSTGHALIVDDEPGVREILIRHLVRAGYTTTDCEDPAKAMEVITQRDDLGVIYLDLTMPRITGIEMHSRIRKSHPEVPIVFISGFSEETVRNILEADKHTYFLQKPFTREEFQVSLAAFAH
jgi:PAS domain S-box-containing protein